MTRGEYRTTTHALRWALRTIRTARDYDEHAMASNHGWVACRLLAEAGLSPEIAGTESTVRMVGITRCLPE